MRNIPILPLSLAMILFASLTAKAMDAFEYQIYDADINKIAEYSLETHLNFSNAHTHAARENGHLSMNGLTHFTLEGARGMTEFWEMGAYLQAAILPDGSSQYAGGKIRSKFVRPRREGDVFQLGANFEIGNVPPNFEKDRWGFEVRPIFGYTLSRITLTFNPIFDVSLTSGSSATPDFAPALKLVCDTRAGFGLGLEYSANLTRSINCVLSKPRNNTCWPRLI